MQSWYYRPYWDWLGCWIDYLRLFGLIAEGAALLAIALTIDSYVDIIINHLRVFIIWSYLPVYNILRTNFPYHRANFGRCFYSFSNDQFIFLFFKGYFVCSAFFPSYLHWKHLTFCFYSREDVWRKELSVWINIELMGEVVMFYKDASENFFLFKRRLFYNFICL